ncbi:hypothetical protein K435DRAFT_744373 [Dendrothele bispora CBS 962.96]|uniref:Chalcone isomerase domain-containing protein n=1 Tax=Dendrothele bispora (strain CBS 962.96) TaxID=1314807 RepID=A0A4S8MUJ4_DENBC|nr:hypothetical protein K435DRAFT_744373 [Dendrothele bispora CBS 962.96]
MSFLQFARRLGLSACIHPTHGPRRGFHSSFTRPVSSIKHLAWGAGLLLSAATIPLFSRTVRLDAEPLSVESNAESTIDAATGIEFPSAIRVAAKFNVPLLSLVGVGVRTVSFLSIKVYSVGFYADLNNPKLKITSEMTPDEKIAEVVRNSACVIRIVPTRNTSFTHLRDAFIRALNDRMNLGRKSGALSEDEALEAGSPIRKLKTLFPNSPLTKHTPFDIFLSEPVPGKPRALIFRDLGAIENDWVANEFVLHYFEGAGPSPPLKKSVVQRLENFEK